MISTVYLAIKARQERYCWAWVSDTGIVRGDVVPAGQSRADAILAAVHDVASHPQLPTDGPVTIYTDDPDLVTAYRTLEQLFPRMRVEAGRREFSLGLSRAYQMATQTLREHGLNAVASARSLPRYAAVAVSRRRQEPGIWSWAAADGAGAAGFIRAKTLSEVTVMAVTQLLQQQTHRVRLHVYLDSTADIELIDTVRTEQDPSRLSRSSPVPAVLLLSLWRNLQKRSVALEVIHGDQPDVLRHAWRLVGQQRAQIRLAALSAVALNRCAPSSKHGRR